MDKSIVLNICGVKSLGGLKVVNSAINTISESEYQLIILHNNNLTEPIDTDSNIIKIETSLKRFFHPFLNVFLSIRIIVLHILADCPGKLAWKVLMKLQR